MAIFGATGAGKSTLLCNMIAWDIDAGAGVSVVDPYGQFVDDLLDNQIPRARKSEVILFRSKNRDHAIGLNVLDCPC